MKFLYEYRTPDNVKHNGEVCAANREAAYALLKSKGVKPSRFAEAPGFFNVLFGKGKRWIAIGVLAIAAVALALVSFSTKEELKEASAAFDGAARRQIIGDAAIVELGVKMGWPEVFDLEGDRFLAGFAVPGVPVAVRNTTEEALGKALDSERMPRDGDGIEARQIIAIVSGMKREIRALVADGWTLKEVGSALVKRQEREIGYYNRARNEIVRAKSSGVSAEEVVKLWKIRNDELRNMGIKLIAFPENDEKNP